MRELARLLRDMLFRGVRTNDTLFAATAQMRYTEAVSTTDADVLVAVPAASALDVLRPISAHLPFIIAEKQKYGYIESMNAIVTMTSRGVLTLPAKLRKAVGLQPDDPIIAETTAEGILLRPAVTLPVEVYSEERVREFDEAEAELSVVLRGKRKR